MAIGRRVYSPEGALPDVFVLRGAPELQPGVTVWLAVAEVFALDERRPVWRVDWLAAEPVLQVAAVAWAVVPEPGVPVPSTAAAVIVLQVWIEDLQLSDGAVPQPVLFPASPAVLIAVEVPVWLTARAGKPVWEHLPWGPLPQPACSAVWPVCFAVQGPVLAVALLLEHGRAAPVAHGRAAPVAHGQAAPVVRGFRLVLVPALLWEPLPVVAAVPVSLPKGCLMEPEEPAPVFQAAAGFQIQQPVRGCHATS